jgi:hypothetical protein
MKKFKKILLALFLAAGCIQGVFADYIVNITVQQGTRPEDWPHQEKDEDGNLKWVATNNKTGEKEFLDLDTDPTSESYQDPNDPNTYSEYNCHMQQQEVPNMVTINIPVSGKEPTDEDLDEAIKYVVQEYEDQFNGNDALCKDDLIKSIEILENNNNEEAAQIAQVEQENQKADAQSLVDPILSTSGQYVFSENDLTVTIHGTTYNIGRFYNSGKKISDNLGKDWYFTLDSRVIRGLRNDIVNEKESILSNTFAGKVTD